MMEDIVYVERDMMEYKIWFNVIYVMIGKFYIIFIKSFYSYNLYKIRFHNDCISIKACYSNKIATY